MRQLQATTTLSFTDERSDAVSLERMIDQHQRRIMDDHDNLLDWAGDVTGDHGVELIAVKVA